MYVANATLSKMKGFPQMLVIYFFLCQICFNLSSFHVRNYESLQGYGC